MKWNVSSWYVSVLILVVAVGFLIFLFSLSGHHHERHHVQYQTKLNTAVDGIFYSPSNFQRSFFHPEDGEIVQHRQGTTPTQDEVWQFDPVTGRYFSSQHFGEMKDGVFTIMDEHRQIIDSLVRSSEVCPAFTGKEPQFMTFDKNYDLVKVPESQQDELHDLLTRKKICAIKNDWHLPVKEEHYKMAKGVFAMDKKRTCFFYLALDAVHMFQYGDILTVDVSEWQPLLFAGSML